MAVTAQEQLLQLANESKAILEAAALLDEPFSVPLLIDLGFSPDSLDPLFDKGIFRESLPDQAEFTNSELRNGLLDQISWSKKRHFCEQVGELLRKRRDSLDRARHGCVEVHRGEQSEICSARAAEHRQAAGVDAECAGMRLDVGDGLFDLFYV